MNAPDVISAPFDDLRAREVRLIEEAFNRVGPVDVRLWTDRAIGSPTFPFDERKYVIEALRFVRSVVPTDDPETVLPDVPREVLDTFPPSPACPDDPQSARK